MFGNCHNGYGNILMNFKTTQTIIKEIINIVDKHKLDYIDAVIYYMEKNNIEFDVMTEIINSNDMLKSKLQIEAECLHIIKKTSRLPI